MKNNLNDDPDFYEELDDSKVQGSGQSFSFWSFILVWVIIFLLGVALILIYGSTR